MAENDEYSVNKMKDFLTIYNKMAETCFNHCIENFNCRDLTSTEGECIEHCSTKGLGVNHKLMMAYIDVQPEIMNKRTDELQRQQKIIEEQVSGQQNIIEEQISQPKILEEQISGS